MKYSIYIPQPFQDFLCRQTVEHIGKDLKEKKFGKPQIYSVTGQPFGYVIKDGHHRLFAAHRLGIKKVDFDIVQENIPPAVLKSALELYDKNIRSVKGLENKLLDELACALILMARGGL